MGFFSGIFKSIKKIAAVAAPLIGMYVGGLAGKYLTGLGGTWGSKLFGTTIGNIVGGLAGTLTSGLISAGTQAKGVGGSVDSIAAGVLVNKVSNNAPIPVVYGERKVGGTRVLMEVTGDDNEYLHNVIVLSEGEVDSIGNVYLSDVLSTDSKFFSNPEESTEVMRAESWNYQYTEYSTEYSTLSAVTLNNQESNSACTLGSTFGITGGNKIWVSGGCRGTFNLEGTLADADQSGGDLASIWKHTGSDTQAANSTLVSAVDDWTTSHQLKGTAYLYVRLKYDQTAFAGGFPTINAVVKGVKVYDPRTSTTAWSDNPALCIRDYLTDTRYGRGIDTSLVDDTSFIDAANHCDELVTIGGESKKRYTCNGIVDTSMGSMDILKNLATSCRGAVIFTGGKYKLVIDKVGSASFTFSEDNIVGGWSIKLGDKTNQFNRITANYFNPDNNWQADIAVIDSDTLRTQDNGLLLEKTIELPFTSDVDRAKMISTINLNQSRQSMLVEFNATIEGMRCEVFDLVYIKHETPAWHTLNGGLGKIFRVVDITLQNDNEVRVLAMEYDATSYDFGTIAVTDAAPDTNLPNMSSVKAPTAISATESLYDTIGSGGVKARVDIEWLRAQDYFVDGYEVQWRENGTNKWTYLTTTKNTEARLDDANPVVHDFRVRAFNTAGAFSSWAYLNNFTVAGLTTPPVDVANLSLLALNNSAHFSWDLATDLDVRVGGKVRFKHSSKTSGAVWQSATDIGSSVSGNNTNIVLPLLKGTYLAKFVDSAGNESLNANSFTLNQVPNVLPMNIVTTSTQHPDFTGTKTNMVALDGVLKFEADTLIDGVTDLIDDWELIDAIGGVDTSGSYVFDSYIDLGTVYTSRVIANLEFTGFVIGDYIDDRTALMDTWQDFENFPSDITVNLYVATTDDDPSGSPTWSAWQKFTVGDYICRAYKFKVEASTTDPDHQINISNLSVEVDMPDRVQGDRNLTTLTTGYLSVTYPNPFKETPYLSISVLDLDENDVLRIANETNTGFDVAVFQGASHHAHTFNYVAKGY